MLKDLREFIRSILIDSNSNVLEIKNWHLLWQKKNLYKKLNISILYDTYSVTCVKNQKISWIVLSKDRGINFLK